jgi:hypothetical protein
MYWAPVGGEATELHVAPEAIAFAARLALDGDDTKQRMLR